MKVQKRVKSAGRWEGDAAESIDAQLALVFSSSEELDKAQTWQELRDFYPRARILGCSTAGEILGTRVTDDSLTVTAVAFQDSRVVAVSARLEEAPDITAVGQLLASRLPGEGLVHVFVLSEGLHVNGSALVSGIVAGLPKEVAVTGGLAGDGARFKHSVACLDGPQLAPQVVAVGLYGPHLRIGYASLGGWDPFGPERRITRSQGNVLYELDGEPALDLYKRYLGAHADGLPATGLLFPLTVRAASGDDTAVVRTILSVDEEARTLTFAGDVPQGFRARLMRANFERLVEGAAGAAQATRQKLGAGNTDLAILISCVGRKLVLKQRTEEEIEAVRHVLGERTPITGFYSYGEICPFTPTARCELHNQTMTITTIAEH